MEEEKTNANPETLLGDMEAKTRELIGLFAHFFSLLRRVLTKLVFLFHEYLKIHAHDRLGRNVECFPVVTKGWQPVKIFLCVC